MFSFRGKKRYRDRSHKTRGIRTKWVGFRFLQVDYCQIFTFLPQEDAIGPNAVATQQSNAAIFTNYCTIKKLQRKTLTGTASLPQTYSNDQGLDRLRAMDNINHPNMKYPTSLAGPGSPGSCNKKWSQRLFLRFSLIHGQPKLDKRTQKRVRSGCSVSN